MDWFWFWMSVVSGVCLLLGMAETGGGDDAGDGSAQGAHGAGPDAGDAAAFEAAEGEILAGIQAAAQRDGGAGGGDGDPPKKPDGDGAAEAGADGAGAKDPTRAGWDRKVQQLTEEVANLRRAQSGDQTTQLLTEVRDLLAAGGDTGGRQRQTADELDQLLESIEGDDDTPVSKAQLRQIVPALKRAMQQLVEPVRGELDKDRQTAQQRTADDRYYRALIERHPPLSEPGQLEQALDVAERHVAKTRPDLDPKGPVYGEVVKTVLLQVASGMAKMAKTTTDAAAGKGGKGGTNRSDAEPGGSAKGSANPVHEDGAPARQPPETHDLEAQMDAEEQRLNAEIGKSLHGGD